MTSVSRFLSVLGLAFCATAVPVTAVQGQSGAVSEAMAGGGVAAPSDLLTAFTLNPAGLLAFDGDRADFGLTILNPTRSLSSTRSGRSGETEARTQYRPLPAFGWSSKMANRTVVYGLGVLETGGFGVRYPGDPANPLLDSPTTGFGGLMTAFRHLTIRPTLAYALTDRLWLGGSLHLDWASLDLDPLRFADPDGAGDIYPRGAEDDAFGVAYQFGIVWNANDVISAGASYTSRGWLDEFVIDGTAADPDRADFGAARSTIVSLETPARLEVGAAMRPLPNLLVTGDARYVFYEDAALYGDSGFGSDGAVLGFGFENTWAFALGAELKPVEWMALRGGFRKTDSPLPESRTFFGLGGPFLTESVASGGIGLAMSRRMAVHLGYTHSFETTISGPWLRPSGSLQGAEVGSVSSMDAFHLQFSIVTRGSVF